MRGRRSKRSKQISLLMSASVTGQALLLLLVELKAPSRYVDYFFALIPDFRTF